MFYYVNYVTFTYNLVSFSGGNGEGVTPVPIPNTAVKPFCADGTWDAGPWESRTPPELIF